MAAFRLRRHSRVYSLQNQNKRLSGPLQKKLTDLCPGRGRRRGQQAGIVTPSWSPRVYPCPLLCTVHNASGMSLLTHKPGDITTCSEPIPDCLLSQSPKSFTAPTNPGACLFSTSVFMLQLHLLSAPFCRQPLNMLFLCLELSLPIHPPLHLTKSDSSFTSQQKHYS